MKLEFQPVDRERWPDFESLFESKGGPHYCWCTLWHTLEKKKQKPDKSAKKAAMAERVNRSTPIGILAYYEDKPVGWCSVAPRDSYRSLGGDETKDNVWSIVCFFIKRPYRRKGITTQLLGQAIAYAQKNGAKYVEAYPVEPDSPSYRFMGFKPTFEKANFAYIKPAGKRRHVMLLKL